MPNYHFRRLDCVVVEEILMLDVACERFISALLSHVMMQWMYCAVRVRQ